ncbi:MAG TPA: PorP/SprF family type IX secretion system membrane protein [Bacteroidia bacterium]|nr:PorP/SprF family type IX secretion system membrane protein [Bacteroidia bacterium]
MTRIITRIIFFISAFTCLKTNAQDPHFSQYFNTPLYVNPANAGNGIEYMRATLIYRNQWASVATPFVTEGFMIDKTVNRLGFGFFAVKNSAGKASLKQLNLAGVLSYNQPLGENNQVSGALQIGMLHKSFDPSEMTFDSQFNEDIGFDPSVSSGEEFTYTSITRPDAGIGFMWQHGFGNKKINFKPFAGFSFNHINKPSETFIVSGNKLPVKSNFNFGAGIMLKDNLELRPSVLYMTQGHFHELNFGAVAGFTMENNNKFQVGLYDRSNDALIVYAGYQVSQVFIGTSYDINMSGLKQASHGSGGFEITLSYIPKARKKSKAPEPKKTQKTALHKTPQKVQKAEKKISIPQVEQTVSIPEKLEAVPINPVIEKPIVREKPQEQTPVAAVPPKEEVKPVNPVVEKPIVKEKPQEQTPVAVAPPKEEVKPVIKEKIVPVVAKEISAVKESKTETPSKLQKPVEVKENVKEAPIEFSAVPKETKVIAPPGKAEEHNTVLPKSHTVYLDVNKKAIAAETKAREENQNLDTDGDGIPDKEDHCPYIKGGKPTQGCPDSDGDGIQDMMDECPMEPGTPKNFGCPEIKPTVDNSALIKKFNNIEFETGSSKIKTADIYDIIEYAIDLLYQYPASRVLLSGHTDSEGNNLFNMHLSEKRNMIVKNYMMKKGIDSSRIQIVNYGETMPLDDNTTAAGRAKNRRVEVNILRNQVK